MRILLVEDDEHDVASVLRSFESGRLSHRATVDVVRDGRTALDHLFVDGHVNGNPLPHLIVLDLKLPNVDGLEVLRQVKGEQRTRRIPVVVLTGATDPGYIAECYTLGANSFVRKPVNSDGFADVIRAVGEYWVRLNEPPST